MSVNVTITVDQDAPLTATVTKKKPDSAPFNSASGRSKHDQLRDLLWSGSWQLKATQIIVWDEAKKQWLLWEG